MNLTLVLSIALLIYFYIYIVHSVKVLIISAISPFCEGVNNDVDRGTRQGQREIYTQKKETTQS